MARLQPDGSILHLVLDEQEVEVLASLAEGLADRIASGLSGAGPDAVIDRLTPTVSRGDADLDAELRGMLRGELLETREARLSAFARDLRASQHEATRDVDRRLDRAAAMQVVEVLNDLRLALAATIGFDEEFRQDLAETDPRNDAVRLMDALAWLQGGLIDFVDGDA
jgi:hypothetical protein